MGFRRVPDIGLCIVLYNSDDRCSVEDLCHLGRSLFIEVPFDEGTGIELEKHEALSAIFQQQLRDGLLSLHLRHRLSRRGFLSAPRKDALFLKVPHLFLRRPFLSRRFVLLARVLFADRSKATERLALAGDKDCFALFNALKIVGEMLSQFLYVDLCDVGGHDGLWCEWTSYCLT